MGTVVMGTLAFVHCLLALLSSLDGQAQFQTSLGQQQFSENDVNLLMLLMQRNGLNNNININSQQQSPPLSSAFSTPSVTASSLLSPNLPTQASTPVRQPQTFPNNPFGQTSTDLRNLNPDKLTIEELVTLQEQRQLAEQQEQLRAIIDFQRNRENQSSG